MAPVIAVENEQDILIEKIVQFEKYAHLLSERFDIKIVFDGANAFTDGKEIHLPNLITLTIKEIDVLYGILLHEIGHIRHTQFEGMEPYYERCTTYNQVLLSNAIEDARIENKLMQEFGGARDMFENLYGLFANDPKYVARIFRMKEKASADWYHDFCRCVHGHLSDLSYDRAKSIGKNYKKVDALYSKVAKIVASHPLKSHKDSFELAFKIYDVIFAQLKDKSEKTDFAERNKAKQEAEKLVQKYLDEYNKLVEENEALREKLKGMRSEKRQIKNEQEQFHKQVEKDVDSARKQMNQATDMDWKLRSPEYAEQQIANAKENLKQKQDALKAVQDKMDAKTAKQEEYKQKMQKATPSAKEKLEKSIEAQERMKKSLQKKLDEAQKEVSQAQKNLQNAENYKQQAQQDAQKVQLTPEQIEKMYEDASKKVEEIEKTDEEKYGSKMEQLANKIRQQNQQYQNQLNQMEQQLGQKMKELDQKLKDMGMPSSGIAPEFKENPDWKESDAIQKQFDDKATAETGKPVVNGCGAYGTNLRDMISSLEDVSNKLQEINVAEIFDAESHDSMIDCINDMEAPITNTRANEAGETYTATRRHVPYTTRFDIVKEETGGKGSGEIEKIKTKRAKDIAKLTQLLRNKFKFHSKPKFRGGVEEGYLDARELWQIPKGTSTKIFETIEKKIDSKVQVAIALDISGSMDKEEIGYGQNLKELAVVMSESLSNAKVKHEVLGFHAPVNFEMQATKASGVHYNRTMHNLETVVYRTLGGAQGLQNIELQTSDNSDGESLRVVGKRLANVRSKKRIVFVVSDNKPFLTDSDIPTLDQDLKNAVNELKAQGIEVFGIGWNETGRDFYGENYCNLEKDVDSLISFLDKKLAAIR